MTSLDIIIVGAGLGGLSASISCALAGHKVTVLEGARELAEVGAGLQITPNASKLLIHKWGLGEQMEKLWAEPKTCSVHRYSDGKILAHDDSFNKRMIRKYGAPFVDVHRVDMQKILYNKAVELGVEVKLSHRVASITQNEKGQPQIQVEHKSGGGDGTADDSANGETKKTTTLFTADLIVGADGLWSRCRESLLSQTDKPLPTGDLAYRIVLSLSQVSHDAELRAWISNPTLHFWIGPLAHAVGYSVRRGEMYNLVLLVPDDLPAEVSRRPGSVDEMRTLFAGWDPILTRLLDCVTTVDKWKLMHRAELDTWTNEAKNFVLIGDSCHPMLPYLAQGANSSIEDGAVLGRVLSHVKEKNQLGPAIAMYENLRKTRSERIVKETFHQRRDFHLPDGPEQEERDRLFESQLGKEEPMVKFPSRWTCPEVQPWLYGYDGYEEVDEEYRRHPF